MTMYGARCMALTDAVHLMGTRDGPLGPPGNLMVLPPVPGISPGRGGEAGGSLPRGWRDA